MLPFVSLVKCREADYLLFNGPDAISNSLFSKGQWEEHLLTVSQVFINDVDSPLIIDIGANLGAYSIPLARRLQSLGGKVIGFEPQRTVYYQLCGNVILNRLDNYEALHMAVGDVDGHIEIPCVNYQTNANIGAFSLHKSFREAHGIESSMRAVTHKVPIMKLDGLDLDTPPALIKMDVEGYEINVLKGAMSFLERHQFPPILFEAWNFDWYRAMRQELLDFVAQLGYRVTCFNNTDYVAQHPQHAVQVDFVNDGQGMISMHRLR